VDDPIARRSRPGVRAAYLALYGLFAALGAGLLARPALLTLRGLGLFAPALPWEVPLGGAAAGLFLVLGLFSVRLAVASALGARPRLPEHALFLALLSAAIAVRSFAGEPTPPADPSPALLSALRAAAEAADAQYAARHSYALDEAALDAQLSTLPLPGFRYRGRSLPLRSRVLAGASGPQLAAAASDLPGTILFAISPDSSRCWMTALTLRAGTAAVFTSEDRPIVLQARGGTHGAPGRDQLVPAYPSMRAVGNERGR
jgi:hypothetical protein